MKLVKDHETNAVKRSIGGEHACENAFGDDFNSCARTDAGFTAHAKSDGVSNAFTKLPSHEVGGGAGCEAPWFEHHHSLRAQPRLMQQCERNACGFAGSGWRFKDSVWAIRKRTT